MPVLAYDECRHLRALIRKYPGSPSYALVRVPELAYLLHTDALAPSLDHCCGDGFFAGLFHPDGFTAGVDFSEDALRAAALAKSPSGSALYGELKTSDVSRELPWPNATFQTVVNNSGLEHVEGLDGALREIARVLRPRGRFVFTLPARRALEWWPADLGPDSRDVYCRLQPMHNLLTLEEWHTRLEAHGLRLQSFESHFDRAETEFALRLDYLFSMRFLQGWPLPLGWSLAYSRRSLARLSTRYVVGRRSYHSFPGEDLGGFYCITGVREGLCETEEPSMGSGSQTRH